MLAICITAISNAALECFYLFSLKKIFDSFLKAVSSNNNKIDSHSLGMWDLGGLK